MITVNQRDKQIASPPRSIKKCNKNLAVKLSEWDTARYKFKRERPEGGPDFHRGGRWRKTRCPDVITLNDNSSFGSLRKMAAVLLDFRAGRSVASFAKQTNFKTSNV